MKCYWTIQDKLKCVRK